MANSNDPKDIKVDINKNNMDQHADDPAVKQPDDPKDMHANEHANPDAHDVAEAQKNYSSVHQGKHVQEPTGQKVVGGKSELDKKVEQDDDKQAQASDREGVKLSDDNTNFKPPEDGKIGQEQGIGGDSSRSSDNNTATPINVSNSVEPIRYGRAGQTENANFEVGENNTATPA
ncbi:MAG: hypothetical protein KDH94_05835, partial [Coxiellaceae bacterium]|nr:hypothetical protein [Coxiellaceae bacterium]